MKKLKLDAYDIPAFISGKNDYYDVTEGESIYHTVVGVHNMFWTHTNIWGFPYEMKIDEGRVAVYWIEEEGQYKRIILPYFVNVQYDGGITGYRQVNNAWGNPEVIVINDNSITLNYGYCDVIFPSPKEFYNDILKPRPFDFTQFCNEIFGNG